MGWQTPEFNKGKCSIIGLDSASNYQTLIDKNNIKTEYEVYVIIMGITVAKIGLDYYEITPDKSFTSDFGID